MPDEHEHNGSQPDSHGLTEVATTSHSEGPDEWICASECQRRHKISREKLLRAVDAGMIPAITRHCLKYQLTLVHADSAEALFGSDGPLKSGTHWRAKSPTARSLSSEIEAT